jgi:archaellum component FlaF (FlaF/FlaG flagellin family)
MLFIPVRKFFSLSCFIISILICVFYYTGYTQKDGAVSKVNKIFISHLTRAQHTPSAVATVQVSHALNTVLQCVQPGSHNTQPHGNQIHARLSAACPL